MRRPQLSDWLILAGLVVAWGSSFFMTKIAVTHIDPVWVMALRLAIAGVFLLVFALVSGYSMPREPKLWGWFAWLGLIGNAAPFFLISWGTQFVTSGLSGVLMGAVPLMVIVLAHLLLPDERLNFMKSAGFAVGFAGLLIVLGIDRVSGFSGESSALAGELAILLACLCYSVHGIFARWIPYSQPVEQSVAVCLCGAVIGLVFAMIGAPSGPVSDEPLAYLAVAGLGILPTGIASVLVYRLLRSCGVSFVAYSNYLVPVFALAFGAVSLGEPLTWNAGAGLALILAGIAVSRMRWLSKETVT